MNRRRTRRGILMGSVALLLLGTAGCNTFHNRHELQGDNWAQVLRSEESQVKVRNAQSRFFDTTDKRAMLEAVVATFQDLGFQVEVLEETLGIVSGKKYLDAERPSAGGLPTYLLYDEESLVVFNRNYRSWGPFQARADMVRLTVTVRKRNENQLIVRASSQFFLRPVEDQSDYRAFFAALEQALFTQRNQSSRSTPSESEPGSPDPSALVAN